MSKDARLDSVARALASEDASARMLALEVILEFSEDRAAGLLAAALHDPDRAVRRAAMRAAARLRSERAVSSLILALDTTDLEQRAEALRAIEAITDQAIDASDFDDPAQRLITLDALQAWWKTERVRRLVSRARELDSGR